MFIKIIKQQSYSELVASIHLTARNGLTHVYMLTLLRCTDRVKCTEWCSMSFVN